MLITALESPRHGVEEKTHTKGVFFFGKQKKPKKQSTNSDGSQFSGKLASICQLALMQSDWRNH
jgi:hypothetical protein